MAELELQESVIHINRVAKVVKGGRNFAFTALVAVGDGNGRAGIGYGKGSEVPLAIQKAIENAKKNIQDIPMAGSTIVHSIIGKHGSSRIFLKPASPGTGIIAGASVRLVLEQVGINNILTKRQGSKNILNLVRATMNALNSLKDAVKIANKRGVKIERVFN